MLTTLEFPTPEMVELKYWIVRGWMRPGPVQVRKGDIIKLIEGQQGGRDAQDGDPFGWRDLIYNGLVECVAFCPPCS